MLIELQHSFKIYDLDKNGTMNSTEFKQVLLDLGKRDVTDDMVNEMLSKVDRNNDKVISWDEFLHVTLMRINKLNRCSKGWKQIIRVYSQRYYRLIKGKNIEK